MPRPSGGIGRREPCAKCGLPVFIAERLNVGKQLYHRTCFRCARCNSQLTLANYYETETENQFCCETCPDEEHKEDVNDSADKMVLNRSLSDEEKSAGLQKFEEPDDYSADFESALENPDDPNLTKNYTLSNEQSTKFMQARSRFITSQLEKSESSEDESIPDLPKSEPPSLPKSEPPGLPKTEPPDFNEIEFARDSENINIPKDLNESISSIVESTHCESFDSGYPSNIQSLEPVVNNSAKLSDFSDKNQPETATKQLDVNEVLTKENKFLENKRDSTSLVKSRMLLFEKQASEESNERPYNSGTKSPEKKFIHNVPLDKDEKLSSTGSHFEKSEIVDVDSDIRNNKNSLVDVNKKNSENRTEVNDVQEEISEKLENSIITISSDSMKVDDSPIVISDSSSEVKSDDTEEPPIGISDSSSKIKREDTKEEETAFSPDKNEEYPESLNPFGDEEEEEESKNTQVVVKPKPISLNPFDEDEDEPEQEQEKPIPKPAVRKKIKVRPSSGQVVNPLDNTLDHLNDLYTERYSFNPFEEGGEEKEPAADVKRVTPAPRISLNPFWSDGEEPEEEDAPKPVPLPRNSRSYVGTPEPKPRKSGLSINSGLSSSTFGGSNTSLASATSTATTGRKKKQAPKPPSVTDKQDSAHSSVTSSPSPSVQHSPKSTRARKAKKAPLPPSLTSTPFMSVKLENDSMDISPINPKPDFNETAVAKGADAEWDKEKIMKDELNRNRQSQAVTSPVSSSDNSLSLPAPHKSTYGKWKRRKGPAPSRPIPQRRHIKPLPTGEIKRELEFIEIQQQGLEKQGVRLEQIIREKCEGPNADLDSSLAPEVDDLILQLFELVNEKNELFRKQAELMYLRRQQRLEEEYADLEYQIRCLMLQPEANKTDCDKAREEELISRLVHVVERRNEIVECLEMDRVREAEEDDSINIQLNLYASRRDEDSSGKNTLEVKHKKKNKKEKKFKFKHSKKLDVDKDIDECESSSSSSHVKEKKKKKFNIF